MKRSNMILMTAAVVLAQFFVQRTGCAQQMYKAIVNAIVISTNSSGLSYQRFGTSNFSR